MWVMWLVTRMVSPGLAVRMKFMVMATVTTEAPTEALVTPVTESARAASTPPWRRPPVIIVLHGIRLQAYGYTAAVDFINVNMEIIGHEPVFFINIPDMLSDFLRISQLFHIGIHSIPILF